MLLMWQVSWTAARLSTCLTSGEEGGLGKYGHVDVGVRVPLGECVVRVCTYVKLCERAYRCETVLA